MKQDFLWIMKYDVQKRVQKRKTINKIPPPTPIHIAWIALLLPSLNSDPLTGVFA